MWQDMTEQVDVLQRLVDDPRPAADLGDQVRSLAPPGVVMLARGSSRYAAIHAAQVLEWALGRPVLHASTSLMTWYGRVPDVRGWLVIAISQSGATPEIVAASSRYTEAGATVFAVTNDPESAVSQEVSGVLTLGAGAERAVPATKTFTASVVALAQLAAACGDVPWGADALRRIPAQVAAVLAGADAIRDRWGSALERAARPVFVGRGFDVAAAYEGALKVREAAGVAAEGYSAFDLLHGPVAAVGPSTLVLGVDGGGPTRRDVAQALAAASERGADTGWLAPPDARDDLATSELVLGEGAGLSVVALTVGAQILAHDLALRLGRDPAAPPGLSKVTPTR